MGHPASQTGSRPPAAPSPGASIPPILFLPAHPATLWLGSGSRKVGCMHTVRRRGRAVLSPSQASRTTGDLTGTSLLSILHPGTKLIPVWRFQSLGDRLSVWVGRWAREKGREGEIDFALGQGTVCHVNPAAIGRGSWRVHSQRQSGVPVRVCIHP